MSVSFDKIVVKLLTSQIISEEQLDEAKKEAQKNLKNLEEVLLEKGYVIDEQIGKIKAELLDIPYIKLGEINIPAETLHILPYTVAASQQIVVFGDDGERLKVAMAEPDNLEIIYYLEKKAHKEAEIFYATPRDIRVALNLYTRDINKRFDKILKTVMEDPSKVESLKEATKILDTIVSFAHQSNVSDIHIEPQENEILIRYRMDGILHDVGSLPKEVEDLVVTRIKVLAGLKTDEHASAQDGRFKFNCEGDEVTLRVSIVPIYDGEKCVLRVLSSKPQKLDLKNLGFAEKQHDKIKDNSKKTHGMILVTGPTGSGKTTTLYAVLQMLNSREINISTVEDPIEYHLKGVNQIQVNNETNLTFSNGLRALLRQDPDVIMVGEIRDEETANIAVNAALTGHLVLASLHTNNAVLTLPRLLEMGVEPFLVTSTVNIAMAQRLVRKICPKCKEKYTLDQKEVDTLKENLPANLDLAKLLDSWRNEAGQIELYRGRACDACNFTKFSGRCCVTELMELNDDIKKAILEKMTPKQIEAVAVKTGMITMLADGLAKVRAGVTTLEELFRVVRE